MKYIKTLGLTILNYYNKSSFIKFLFDITILLI